MCKPVCTNTDQRSRHGYHRHPQPPPAPRTVNQRQQQKRLTRRSLLDAALALLADGRLFASLGLREVTRAAGLSAPAFYRHFEDMDALGLALVDEAGVALRQLMRDARQRVEAAGQAIPTSVQTFMEYLDARTPEFRLIVSQSQGGSPAFRQAIARERDDFARELADDLHRMALHRERPVHDRRALADAMVTLVFTAGARMLDDDTPTRRQRAEALGLQLRMLQLGAEALAEAGAG